LVVIAAIVAPAAQTQKAYKDHGEYELFSEATKQLAANNHAKALESIQAWSAKYPESNYDDERRMLAVQAYSAVKEPGKAIDAAAPLLDRKLETLPGGPASIVRLLYSVIAAVPQVPDATDKQLASAAKAARALDAFDKTPDGVTPEAWAQARADLRKAAASTLLHIALLPVTRALKTKDCASAESGARAALESHPNSAQASWYLASAQLCSSTQDPANVSAALYGFARAAALPAAAAMVDPKWQQSTVEPYLRKLYTQYHGDDPDGLRELKELAARQPLPPQGFLVKSAAEVEQAKNEAFASTHPELALWMKIHSALSAPNGEEYFAAELKDAAVPLLAGVLVEAKPACRPAELLIAIKSPESSVRLQLSKPLAGRVEPNQDVRWEGVATGFRKDPFLLTMDAETSKVYGLKVARCRNTK
jgi:hypothetical protein